MKKTILIITALLLFSTLKTHAQTTCDSISTDTVYVETNSLYITVYNSSHHFIVYPFFTASLDANPYISLGDTLTVPSFLSVVGDANNGYTTAFYSNVSVVAAASVPYNTLFTGMLRIQDPNDAVFSCSIPFNFRYGNMGASVGELQADLVQLYPNPTKGQFTISLPDDNAEINVTDILGQSILKILATQKITNLQLENNGVYIIYIKTKQGIAKRKLIVNR
jgi:hypothetical protein